MRSLSASPLIGCMTEMLPVFFWSQHVVIWLLSLSIQLSNSLINCVSFKYFPICCHFSSHFCLCQSMPRSKKSMLSNSNLSSLYLSPYCFLIHRSSRPVSSSSFYVENVIGLLLRIIYSHLSVELSDIYTD